MLQHVIHTKNKVCYDMLCYGNRKQCVIGSI